MSENVSFLPMALASSLVRYAMRRVEVGVDVRYDELGWE